QLAAYSESVIRTGSNLEEIKAQHSAAVKAVEAENRKRLDEKKKVNGKSAPTAPEERDTGAEFRDGKPVFGSKAPTGPAVPASLFDPVESATDAATSSPVSDGPAA